MKAPGSNQGPTEYRRIECGLVISQPLNPPNRNFRRYYARADRFQKLKRRKSARYRILAFPPSLIPILSIVRPSRNGRLCPITRRLPELSLIYKRPGRLFSHFPIQLSVSDILDTYSCELKHLAQFDVLNLIFCG